jgi:hypothetical protein
MTIVIAIGGVAEVMAILLSIVAVSTTSAVIDNNNTDARAEALENDSSSTVAANRSLDNSESAKSGINTLATGKMMLLSRLFCCSKD